MSRKQTVNQKFPVLSNEQILGVSKEWTLDCDMLFDDRLLSRTFCDIETVKKNYENMFLEVRADMEIQNPDVTKVYVERIDVVCEGDVILYVIKYDHSREKSFIIGKLKNTHPQLSGPEKTLEVLHKISNIKEGGGKWNAHNDLSAFWGGFISGWRGKIAKLGIEIDPEKSAPITLIDADVPPRISIIYKNGQNKTIITEKKPRLEKKGDGEEIELPECGKQGIGENVTDILVNGKDACESTLGQRTHTLLGVLYNQNLGLGMQEHARQYLEKVLLSSSTLTFNSELPELGGILQAIIDSKILRKNSTKAVQDTLTKLKLHLLECGVFTHREKADRSFLDETHESAELYGMLMDTVLRGDYRSLNSLVGHRRDSFMELGRVTTAEHVLATERVRNELVCSSIEHIVLVMSTLNEEQHRTTYCDMLVTNGQYGMAGLCSMYDYRVIASSKVIEGSPQEKMLIDAVRSRMGFSDAAPDFIQNDAKDTTGCGDISMAAWLSGKLEIGKKLRELEYYQIFKIIGKHNDISAEQYRRAIAITEAYWRMSFTRVMSGLMFRSKAPNMSFISPDAMEYAMRCTSLEVGKFMLKELADFVHGSKYISDNGFFHLHAIAKMNRTGGKGSLEILCEREGITAEDIVVRQGDLLKRGIGTTDEAFRRAKAQLLHEKWGWKTIT